MTHPRAAAIALAIASATAVAQQEAFVSLTHDDADGIIAIGDTVTWALTIGFSGFDPGWVVGVADINIDGDNALGTASDMSYEFFNAGSFQGTSNGAGVSEVRFGNAPFCVDLLCTAATTDNPMLVGTYSFTAASAGTLNYAISEATANWNFVEIHLDQFTTMGFDESQTTITADQLTIIPTPASASLLALTSLLAARRRRH